MKKLSVLLTLITFLLILSACGGGGVDAPEGAAITINPDDFSVTDGTATAEGSRLDYQIVVRNEDGIPLNNVEITISFPWAAPNQAIPGTTLVQLYDGDEAKNSPMTVRTDINGAYNLRFDFLSGGGLAYDGDLTVTSGSAFGSATFAVAAAASEE